MREYVITINDNPYHIVIKKMQTDTAMVEVDGKEYEVGVDRKIKRHVEPLDIKPVQRTAPAVSQPDTQASPVSVGAGEIVAPLPGLILSIMVKTGDAVKNGQTLLKMEAMKMENEIKANRDGVVTKIMVNEGESVLENAPLVKIGD